MFSRLFAVLLLGLVASLSPLAYASPPDPSWIAGLYDDADYDDVVILITASPGTPPAVLVRGLEPHWTPVWLVAAVDEHLCPVVVRPQPPTRGPPLS